MSFRCRCETPPFHYTDFERRDLGDDRTGADVAVETCRKCRRAWLVYLIEEPQFSRSGRWWRVLLDETEEAGLDANAARRLIEAKQWCFVGGSFYDAPAHRKEGPIAVR